MYCILYIIDNKIRWKITSDISQARQARDVYLTKKMNQTSDCNFWYFRYQVIQKQVFKKSCGKPFQSCQLPDTAHSAQIWQISPFIPAYHLLPSKSAYCTIFLKSNSDNPLSGLPENHSERSGSFHDYSNDLRPAVREEIGGW